MPKQVSPEPSPSEDSSAHAKALSKLGAAKGGKARASTLTAEERREIAQKAIRTRWARAKGVSPDEIAIAPDREMVRHVSESLGPDTIPTGGKPVGLFPGVLRIGDGEYPCYVLSNGKRVITQRGMVSLLSDGRESGNLDRYLNRLQETLQRHGLEPFLSTEKIRAHAVSFRVPGSHFDANGYEATLAIEICDAYLRAREAKALHHSQYKIAKQAEIFMRACAKVGIIALIDEATGFQKRRAEQALQIKLQAFIAEDLQEWARLFPEEFWIQLARLENVRYSARSRPLRWGKYVMAFIYDAVDKDMGQKLREINPNPRFRRNHHQWLKEFGRQKVNDHIHQVIGVMKMCRNYDEFKHRFADVFRRASTLQLSFDDAFDFSSDF